jgi:hypothetical protein
MLDAMEVTTMKEKIYKCVCHGCGKIHEVKACFLSTSLTIEIDSRVFGCYGCAECVAVGRQGEAYRNGMTREAMERARREWREMQQVVL